MYLTKTCKIYKWHCVLLGINNVWIIITVKFQLQEFGALVAHMLLYVCVYNSIHIMLSAKEQRTILHEMINWKNRRTKEIIFTQWLGKYYGNVLFFSP